MEIPFDRRVAESYARGEILVETLPDWREKMLALFDAICKVQGGCGEGLKGREEQK
jgi:MinD superfamily P-loop ATPase